MEAFNPAPTTDVTFILLCSGQAEAKSFRPELDETQWWGRRDALVRCASVLWAEPAVAEVVLAHPDAADCALLRVARPAAAACATPTEGALVGAWRDAAAGRPSLRGVVCERNVWRAASLEPAAAAGGASAPAPLAHVEALDKREVLAFLHARCALPFLRARGLNASADAVLRKCNKPALVRAYADWLAEQRADGGRARADDAEAAPAPEAEVRLQRTFEHCLRPLCADGRSPVVLLLHETCANELPVFGSGPARAATDGPPRQLVAVLGAVRDMSEAEARALAAACASLGAPLLRVHLGRVAEFTSKVVAAIAFHAREGRLARATQRLLDARATQRPLDAAPATAAAPRGALAAGASAPPPLCLVVVVPLPYDADALDAARALGGAGGQAARARVHALLRVCVCALWRSRLVRAAATEPAVAAEDFAPLGVCLLLRFACGRVLSLEQTAFVRALAASHQAAPSEAQLLAALCLARDAAQGTLADALATAAHGRALVGALECAREGEGAAEAERAADLAAAAYARPCGCAQGGEAAGPAAALLVLLPLTEAATASDDDGASAWRAALRGAFAARAPTPLRVRLAPRACRVHAWVCVTMLQQFAYHARLLPALRELAHAHAGATAARRSAEGGGAPAARRPVLPPPEPTLRAAQHKKPKRRHECQGRDDATRAQ